MKSKILSILAMSVMLIAGLTSCSDKDNDATNSKPESNLADYTVILWIDGGGHMDPYNLSDLNNMILLRENGSIGKNVNVVGSFSVSDMYKDALKEQGIASVFSFELGEKTGLSSDTISELSKVKSPEDAGEVVNEQYDINIKTTAKLYDMAVHCLKNYADNTSTDMDKSASLAAFIKKAAEEHPAKNYVVYFINHGSGYNPADQDVSLDGTNVRYEGTINSAGVAKAIKDSGVKIQSIVFNCCLMATLENFGILKNSADYIMASCETTFSGYMSQYIANLSAAGDDVEKMKEGTRKIVDLYQSITEEVGPTSHGFYDMSYTDQLLACVTPAAQWFAGANTTNETFMQDVVEGTIYCKPSYPVGVEFMELYAARKAIREMLDTDPALVDIKLFVTNLTQVLKYMTENVSNYYCFGDMMQTALAMKDAPEAKGLDFSSLQSIYDRYISTLRQMAYIKCSSAANEDEGYLYASPSVNLFTMNQKGYFKPRCVDLYETEKDENGYYVVDVDALEKFVKKVLYAKTPKESEELMYQYFGGTWYAHFAKLETVESRYTNFEFDKVTGWSKVLKTLPSNPIYMVNPLRIEKNGLSDELDKNDD